MNPDTPKPAVPQIGEPADPGELPVQDVLDEPVDEELELRDRQDERPEPGDLPI